MLKHLNLRHFTRFGENGFSFSPGLNVFVGENGTGKSHLMKLLYASMKSLEAERSMSQPIPTKAVLETSIARNLAGVFCPDENRVGRLAQRQQGHKRASVEIEFSDKRGKLGYTFSTASRSAVSVENLPGSWMTSESCVYLPTRELLSIYPNFASVYETVEIPFEQTWYDLALLLGRPLPKGPHSHQCKDLIAPLEEVLGGRVLLEHGKFYIRTASGKMEAHLLAEGLRKIGTLAQLMANGTLISRSVLFWDEPEANLNPSMVRLVARTIINLVRQGVQTFVATHSLFLLRELFLRSEEEHEKEQFRYYSLAPQEGEASVLVSSSHSMKGLANIATLSCQREQDEELMNYYCNRV